MNSGFCDLPIVIEATDKEENVERIKPKLDEMITEGLVRMDTIVDHLSPNALVLMNESFSATNEREGSEIAWQVIRELLIKDIQVLFVTHLYDFTRRVEEDLEDTMMYLRAERLTDGTRTFKLNPAKPLETGHSADLYRKIFNEVDSL